MSYQYDDIASDPRIIFSQELKMCWEIPKEKADNKDLQVDMMVQSIFCPAILREVYEDCTRSFSESSEDYDIDTKVNIICGENEKIHKRLNNELLESVKEKIPKLIKEHLMKEDEAALKIIKMQGGQSV